jgi:hypothetical protein
VGLVNAGDVRLPLYVLLEPSIYTPRYILDSPAGVSRNVVCPDSMRFHSASAKRNADQPSQKVGLVVSDKLSIDNIVFNQEFPDGVMLISLVPRANAANHVGVQLTIGNIEDKAKVVIDFRRSGLNLEGVIKNKNFNDFIQKKAIAYLWDETEKADAASQFLQSPVIGINVLDEELVTILGDNDLQ